MGAIHRDLLINQIKNTRIKHGFSRINIRQVPWEVLGLSFQHLPRDLANVNALKNLV